MKNKEKIEVEITKITKEVENLLDEQREAVFTQAVSSLQEIINCKKHQIKALKWVLNE